MTSAADEILRCRCRAGESWLADCSRAVVQRLRSSDHRAVCWSVERITCRCRPVGAELAQAQENYRGFGDENTTAGSKAGLLRVRGLCLLNWIWGRTTRSWTAFDWFCFQFYIKNKLLHAYTIKSYVMLCDISHARESQFVWTVRTTVISAVAVGIRRHHSVQQQVLAVWNCGIYMFTKIKMKNTLLLFSHHIAPVKLRSSSLVPKWLPSHRCLGFINCRPGPCSLKKRHYRSVWSLPPLQKLPLSTLFLPFLLFSFFSKISVSF